MKDALNKWPKIACRKYIIICFSIVRELVKQNKYSVNDEDENSNTALHLAALAGHTKVADHLIEMGADVAAKWVLP